MFCSVQGTCECLLVACLRLACQLLQHSVLHHLLLLLLLLAHLWALGHLSHRTDKGHTLLLVSLKRLQHSPGRHYGLFCFVHCRQENRSFTRSKSSEPGHRRDLNTEKSCERMLLAAQMLLRKTWQLQPRHTS